MRASGPWHGGDAMTVHVNTAQLRSSAGSYASVAGTSQQVAQQLASAAKSIDGEISDPAVSTAVGAALVAVLRGLQFVGGAFDYSHSQLGETADSYDRSDAAAASHLGQLVPRAR